METTFGRTVETKKCNVAEIIDFNNATIKRMLKNYSFRKHSNTSLHEPSFIMTDTNYSHQVVNYPSSYFNTKPFQTSTRSNSCGYSSDNEYSTRQFEQLSMKRRPNQVRMQQAPAHLDRTQQLNERIDRFKSIERQQVNKQRNTREFYTDLIKSHLHNKTMDEQLLSPHVKQKFDRLSNELNGKRKKFILNNDHLAAAAYSLRSCEQSANCQNLNNQFLTWKNFNCDPTRLVSNNNDSFNCNDSLINELDAELLKLNKEFNIDSTTLPR